MDADTDKRRKYPRIKAPKDLHVAWRAAGQQAVSRAETIALGGLFLYTRKVPPVGSMVELVFDLPTGSMRARAIVRHVTEGRGMGIEFVHMGPEHRSKLHQFLIKHAAKSQTECAPQKASAAASQAPAERPTTSSSDFERELASLLSIARTANYYQLLGVTSDTPPDQIKRRFHGLARKFHPDRHMARPELLGNLKELMSALAAAYKTLSDEEKRDEYYRQLARSGAFDLNRTRTEAQMIVEESFHRAKEYIRAGNFVGSIVWLRKCVEKAPNEAVYHRMLARSLGKVPQFRDEAIVHFKKAIELEPCNVEAYANFAKFYEDLGLASQAQAIYAKLNEIEVSTRT